MTRKTLQIFLVSTAVFKMHIFFFDKIIITIIDTKSQVKLWPSMCLIFNFKNAKKNFYSI